MVIPYENGISVIEMDSRCSIKKTGKLEFIALT